MYNQDPAFYADLIESDSLMFSKEQQNVFTICLKRIFFAYGLMLYIKNLLDQKKY